MAANGVVTRVVGESCSERWRDRGSRSQLCLKREQTKVGAVDALRDRVSGMQMLIALPLLFAVVAACSSDSIRRTDLSSWKAMTFPEEGIALDVPTKVTNLPKESPTFLLHSRSNGVADATWFIGVGATRKSAGDFANPPIPTSDNPVSADAEYMKWLQWVVARHDTLSVYEKRDKTRQYRRDLILSNGDIVSFEATYRYAPFSEAEQAADDAAIRRIINSARPIRQ